MYLLRGGEEVKRDLLGHGVSVNIQDTRGQQDEVLPARIPVLGRGEADRVALVSIVESTVDLVA